MNFKDKLFASIASIAIRIIWHSKNETANRMMVVTGHSVAGICLSLHVIY